MFDALRKQLFYYAVMAEIKAQCGDQELVNLICMDEGAREYMASDWLRLRGVKTKIAAFVSAFSVLAYSLYRKDIGLADKKVIAALLNDRDAKAKRNFHFYQANVNLFLAAQSAMHEFCIDNDLEPDELISEPS